MLTTSHNLLATITISILNANCFHAGSPPAPGVALQRRARLFARTDRGCCDDDEEAIPARAKESATRGGAHVHTAMLPDSVLF